MEEIFKKTEGENIYNINNKLSNLKFKNPTAFNKEKIKENRLFLNIEPSELDVITYNAETTDEDDCLICLGKMNELPLLKFIDFSLEGLNLNPFGLLYDIKKDKVLCLSSKILGEETNVFAMTESTTQNTHIQCLISFLYSNQNARTRSFCLGETSEKFLSIFNFSLLPPIFLERLPLSDSGREPRLFGETTFFDPIGVKNVKSFKNISALNLMRAIESIEKMNVRININLFENEKFLHSAVSDLLKLNDGYTINLQKDNILFTAKYDNLLIPISQNITSISFDLGLAVRNRLGGGRTAWTWTITKQDIDGAVSDKNSDDPLWVVYSYTKNTHMSLQMKKNLVAGVPSIIKVSVTLDFRILLPKISENLIESPDKKRKKEE